MSTSTNHAHSTPRNRQLTNFPSITYTKIDQSRSHHLGAYFSILDGRVLQTAWLTSRSPTSLLLCFLTSLLPYFTASLLLGFTGRCPRTHLVRSTAPGPAPSLAGLRGRAKS